MATETVHLQSKTTASQNRKSSKPIMEKRRRARINASLTELKSLLMEVMKKEGTRHHKMEKADILEMAVKHLRNLQKNQFAASMAEPDVISKYQTGFRECTSEVRRYLNSVEGLDVELRARVLNHLANTLQNTEAQTVTGQMQKPDSTGPGSPIHIAPRPAPVADLNNNVVHGAQPVLPLTVNTLPPTASGDCGAQANLMSGLHVVPTKLTNGEIAFVLSGSNVPCVIPVFTQSPPGGALVNPSVQIVGCASPTPIVVAPINRGPSPSLTSPCSSTTPLSPLATPPPTTTTTMTPSSNDHENDAPQDLRWSAKNSRNINTPHQKMETDDEHTQDHAKHVAHVAPSGGEDMWRPW